MYEVKIDFAYDGANEIHEIVEFERDYGVKAEYVSRANGWPVLRVTCSDRKILETLLADRDEEWRIDEIREAATA